MPHPFAETRSGVELASLCGICAISTAMPLYPVRARSRCGAPTRARLDAEMSSAILATVNKTIAAITFQLAAIVAMVAGCAQHVDSPYYARCAKEVQLPDNWMNVGTVKAELFDMCIKRNEAKPH